MNFHDESKNWYEGIIVETIKTTPSDKRKKWYDIHKWTLLATGFLFIFVLISLGLISGTYSHPWLSYSTAIIVPILDVLIYFGLTRTMLHIHRRRDAKVFLFQASLICVLIQVLTDIILGHTELLWQVVIFDAMYNIGFCMLFVFCFKWFDVLFSNFFNFRDDLQ